MKNRKIYLILLMFVLCLGMVNAVDFYADSEGRIHCENASIGDNGTIEGINYTAVDESYLVNLDGYTQNTTAMCTSHVTNLSYVFDDYYGGSSYDISNWDVSNVTDMSYTFSGINANYLGLEKWNVSNVINMSGIFYGGSLNDNLSDWDVSNVQDMSLAFKYTGMTPLGMNEWNVSNVVNMNEMFNEQDLVNLVDYDYDFSSWDTSSLVYMDKIFRMTNYNNPLNDWDVSNVITMKEVFGGSDYNYPLDKWDVSNVKNMKKMFMASDYDNPLNDWDVSNVINMNGMFWASSYDYPLDEWDVSSVTDMENMFRFSDPFNQDLTSWCVSNFDSELEFFSDSSTLQEENLPIWGTCPQPTVPEYITGMKSVKTTAYVGFGLLSVALLAGIAFLFVKMFEGGFDTFLLISISVMAIGLSIVIFIGYIIISAVANGLV